jgi:hypothetical protein
VKSRLSAIALCAGLLIGSEAVAVPLYTDEAKGVAVNVSVLAQPWMQVTAPTSAGRGSPGIGAADGKSPSLDFFLRRVRLMAYGSVTKELSYFIETDQPNLGKGGDFSSSMFIQDAFLTYAFIPEFKIDAGMMLVPLSHHTIEGAVGLNAMDYHAELIASPRAKSSATLAFSSEGYSSISCCTTGWAFSKECVRQRYRRPLCRQPCRCGH